MESLVAFNERYFDGLVEWDAIDRRRALATPRVLEHLREACLIEAYLPIYTGRMSMLFWDDVAATSVFAIEAFEAYGHYYVLRRYLEIVGRSPVSDEDVIRVRMKDQGRVFDDKIRELVNFMGTEHFAAEFFKDLCAMTEEPVLKGILPRFSREEARHSQFAFDLLASRLRKNPELKDDVLRRARDFTHVGAYVLPAVSPAKEDNLKAIVSFNERIGRLVGRRLSDALGPGDGAVR